MENDVLVSLSAGNYGPIISSISNTAPWVITVGASSIDRRFPATVTLGNLEIYRGSSLSKAAHVAQRLPLVYVSHNRSTMRCQSGLHPSMVKGKIVLCDAAIINPYIDSVGAASHKVVGVLKEASTLVKQVGGVAIILANEIYWGAEEIISYYDLPFIAVSFAVGEKIKLYINTTSKPTAAIKPTGLTVIGKAVTAPLVASFSARGPSLAFPDILKPDLVAAYTGGGYYFDSGTSMSCPHVSGLAALTWCSSVLESRCH